MSGSFFGGGSHVYPDDDGSYGGCCYCCRSREPSRGRRNGRLSRGRGYDSRRSSLIDIEGGPYVVFGDQSKNKNKDYVRSGDKMYQEAYVSNGRPPVHHKHNQTLVRSNVIHTSVDSGMTSTKTGDYDANGDVYTTDVHKKPAKELHKWLPHTHPIRNINTSTK
ncbi:hypothetical protein KUTeg_020499 [Tegillarca granosa]|uniref:Uncharacterized protein n=1 Tax=Tegillarca granosa TaxID=220873 RepID=A0ABQ9ED68_TEGGR|nr:hypothetical protein KUTeg_020499 [Tegillarca granosa]